MKNVEKTLIYILLTVTISFFSFQFGRSLGMNESLSLVGNLCRSLK